MSAREVQDQQATAREIFVSETAGASVSISSSRVDSNCTIQNERSSCPASTAENNFYKAPDASTLTRVDAANLIRVVRQLEGIAIRQVPRIAFKVKRRILFLDLAEIAAVQAEGNYVSLRHRANTYLLRESLSSMADKLKPYGFTRIHRSVVVNISAVEEIQPLPTGEYKLRIKGGKEYLVTRTYKDNLRDLAQLWVGSEHLCAFG